MLSFPSTNIYGKEVVFNFFSKFISAGQAQLKNVFPFYQLSEHTRDFCTIQMSKEPQVFNSLVKNCLKAGISCAV